MKNKNTYFLLFKQGIKGIFKFKVQFIIIIILTFLATFILTTSLTITNRLKDSHNAVVGKVEPFDYASTIATDLSTPTDLEDPTRYVALNDFINTDFTRIVKYDQTHSSQFNFNLNAKNGQETFLTKLFADDKLYSSTTRSDVAFLATKYLVEDLSLYIENQQAESVNYLKTSPFANWVLYSEDHKQFIRDIKSIFDKNGVNKINNLGNLSSKEIDAKDTFYYLSLVGMSVSEWYFATIKNYYVQGTSPELLKTWFLGTEADHEKANKDNLEIDLSKTYTAEELNKLNVISVNYPGIESKEETETVTTKGLLGMMNPISLNVTKSANVENEYNITSIVNPISMNGLKFLYGPIEDVDLSSNIKFYFAETLESAIVTAHTSKVEPKDNEVTSNPFNPFDLTDEQYTNLVNLSTVSIIDTEAYSNPIMPMYRYHLKMIGDITNFNVNLRREIITFDNISQTTYRQVVINDEDYSNLTILNAKDGGRMPLSYGEVLINEQYAKFNNIQQWDYIKVGNTQYRVVGLATDAYSYFPVADPTVPIPQSKVSAIIYGTSKTILNSIQATDDAQADKAYNSNLTMFLTEKGKPNLDLFNAYLATSAGGLWDNHNYIIGESNGKPPVTKFVWSTFADSDFSLNWTLLPLVLKIYNAVSVSISILIAIITIAALVICIQKTIKFNAKQIGILKAMGNTPMAISSSYIAHSMILILIVIPLGWIAGMTMQSVFIHMFYPYFSVPLYSFYVDGISIAISFFVFGVLSLIVSLITAYLETRKPIIDILNQTTKWSNSWFFSKLNATIFKNAKFTFRFSLTLSSSGIRNISLLTIVITIASFLISMSIIIPTVTLWCAQSYYKSSKYANTYSNRKLVANSPLAKPTIGFWEGQEPLDNSFKTSVTEGREYEYYIDPMGYSSSSNDISPIPTYLFNQAKGLENTYNYLSVDDENAGAENSDLFQMIVEIFGSNFLNNVGTQFSIGVIEQIFGIVTNSIYEDGIIQEGKILTDKEKLEKYDEITQSITAVIPQILGLLTESSAGSDPTADWKEQILTPLYSSLPPFVKKYLTNPQRKNQFGMGYNVQHFIPHQESLVTEFNASFDEKEKQNMRITGIDETQSAYSLGNMGDDIFFDIKTTNQIQQVFDGTFQGDSIIYNGENIYQKSGDKDILTIPVVLNTQAMAGYKMNKGNVLHDVSTNQNMLLLNDGEKTKPLPKGAWVYDDSDFLESDYYQTVIGSKKADSNASNQITSNRTGVIDSTDGRYLNPFDLDNNKFGFKTQFVPVEEEKKLKTEEVANWKAVDNLFAFNDFTYDETGSTIVSSYARPYYEYKNIKFYIPYSEIEKRDVDKFLFGGDVNSKTTDDLSWFEKELTSDKVPDVVKQAWGNPQDNQWLEISPYDRNYTLKVSNENYWGDSSEALLLHNGGLGSFTSSNTFWLKNVRSGVDPIMSIKDAPVQYQNKNLKINLKQVDELESYNSRLILMDQNIANLINNYSLSRKVGTNNQVFDFDKDYVPAGTEFEGTVSNFDRYHLHDSSQDIYISDPNELKKITYLHSLDVNQNPLYWHTGKMSNVIEPLDLTSGVSFVSTNNAGVNVIVNSDPVGGKGGMGDNELRLMIDSQVLLQTTKDLIEQISTLVISITMLLIIAIITTSALLIILISDIYITQYKSFMLSMKSLGYTNWKIQKYSFGLVTVLSGLMWAVATAGAWLFIYLVIRALYISGFALPFSVTLWPIFASLLIIGAVYLGSIFISTKKIRSSEPAEAMRESQE